MIQSCRPETNIQWAKIIRFFTHLEVRKSPQKIIIKVNNKQKQPHILKGEGKVITILTLSPSLHGK